MLNLRRKCCCWSWGDAATEEQARPLVCDPSLNAAAAEVVPSSLADLIV
jgi:hypothetical protein